MVAEILFFAGTPRDSSSSCGGSSGGVGGGGVDGGGGGGGGGIVLFKTKSRKERHVSDYRGSVIIMSYNLIITY